MRKKNAERPSLEQALRIAMEHVEEPTSKYAAKQRRYSNGVLTESVTLTDVVESMVYRGKVSFDEEARVERISIEDGFYPPSNFGAKTTVTEMRMPLHSKDISDVCGVEPKLAFITSNYDHENGTLVVDGIMPRPYIGLNPYPGEAVRSRSEVRAISRINKRIEKGRVTDLAKPKAQDIFHDGNVVYGVLPCWQRRKTYGEAEPYKSGEDYCVRCSMVCLSEADYTIEDYFRGVEGNTYCTDAIELTLARQIESAYRQKEATGRDIVGAMYLHSLLTDLVTEMEAVAYDDFAIVHGEIVTVVDAKGHMSVDLEVDDIYSKAFKKHFRKFYGAKQTDAISKAFLDLNRYIGKAWNKKSIAVS